LVTTLPLASITGTSGIPTEKPPSELKYSAAIINAYSFIKYLSKTKVLISRKKFLGSLFCKYEYDHSATSKTYMQSL
jgi:hypothetical protein